MTEEPPKNKEEVMARIERSRMALEKTLGSLTEEQLAARGTGDWPIKDHLAHLAVWELGIAELLRGRSRFAAMGVAEAAAQGKSTDEVNDLIYRQHADLSAAEALQKFHEAHNEMLAALQDLSYEDLLKPYGDYMSPDDPPSSAPHDPVAYWIAGNTYGHFDEHNEYIQQILDDEVSEL